MAPRGYADLGDLPEDERIKIFCEDALRGEVVGVVIDNEQPKIDRYIRKIINYSKALRISDRGKGPVKGTYFLKIERIKDLN